MNVLITHGSYSQSEPILRIGLIADPQYSDKPVQNKRHYGESLWKLEEAIDTFNNNRVDLVQTLGDVIDDEWASYDSILPVYDKLSPGIENYHLLGNHDFSIDSSHYNDLLERLSMPNFYYSYNKKGWRFIVLDATDVSFYANYLHGYDVNKLNAYFERTKDNSNHHRWNSAIGNEQQDWLQQQLEIAKSLNQKVVLFSHLPIRPRGNEHNLWNDDEIIDIIENSDNVVAFINGHNHSGNHVLKNGVHYITIFGMVDTLISSYAILDIYENRLVIRGFGNQKILHLIYD
jgi:hypothetical protein